MPVNPFKLVGWIGIAIAVIGAFVDIPYAGLLLVLLGIGLEVAQGMLTATRMADPRDALANTLGVLAGFATVLTPLSRLLLAIDARLLPARA